MQITREDFENEENEKKTYKKKSLQKRKKNYEIDQVLTSKLSIDWIAKSYSKYIKSFISISRDNLIPKINTDIEMEVIFFDDFFMEMKFFTFRVILAF